MFEENYTPTSWNTAREAKCYSFIAHWATALESATTDICGALDSAGEPIVVVAVKKSYFNPLEIATELSVRIADAADIAGALANPQIALWTTFHVERIVTESGRVYERGRPLAETLFEADMEVIRQEAIEEARLRSLESADQNAWIESLIDNCSAVGVRGELI